MISCAKSHLRWLGWGAKPPAKLGCVVELYLIPWDEHVQLDPAIVAREFAAKRQEEVFRRELMTRLASVQVQNFGRLFGQNRLICAHFTAKSRSDPLRRYRSGLFQDAPY